MFKFGKEKTIKVRIYAADTGMIEYFMNKINTTDTAEGFREMLKTIQEQNLDAIKFATENMAMKKYLDDQAKADRPVNYIQ